MVCQKKVSKDGTILPILRYHAILGKYCLKQDLSSCLNRKQWSTFHISRHGKRDWVEYIKTRLGGKPIRKHGKFSLDLDILVDLMNVAFPLFHYILTGKAF